MTRFLVNNQIMVGDERLSDETISTPGEAAQASPITLPSRSRRDKIKCDLVVEPKKIKYTYDLLLY